MEKRFVLFILICFIVIPLYYRFIAPPPQPQPGSGRGGDVTSSPNSGSRESTRSRSSELRSPEVSGAPAPRGEDPGQAVASDIPEFPLVTHTLENEVMRIELTSEGAGVQRVELKNYVEADRQTVLTLLSPELQSGIGLTLQFTDQDFSIPVESLNWELVSSSDSSVVFRMPLGGGRSVTKELTLPASGYELDVAVAFEGVYPSSRDVPYQLLGPERIRFEPKSIYPNSRVFGIVDAEGRFLETEHKAVGAVPQRMSIVGRRISWAGLESNYFALVIRPVDLASTLGRPKVVEIGEADRDRADQYRDNHEFGRQEFPLQVGFQAPISPESTDHFRVFLGPKDPTILAKYKEIGYPELIDYGSLGLLVRLFLFLLRTFEALTSSWGVAIILLTVLVKSLLHPMNKRNQRTMQRQQKKMGKIQPQVKELREKYKGDPLKANQEIQKLFKENDVNPAQMFGGCLMIFLQLPIWIGLINTFRLAIELRQTPFLYISDLTAPDHLARLPFSIPFLGDWFNLLPVLYVAVTLINQRMMPKSDDPQMRQQQKMMTFMMVAFGFIFYGFASGLMVYFLTSSSLGIIEQKMIRSELAKEEDTQVTTSVVGARPAAPPPPKPGQQVKRRS